MSEKINWWTIDNGVENLMINGSLKHTLKQVKKVNKRTRTLNIELKKFAGLKSYKKYVDIKTDVLRNISDNEETDDEIFAENDNNVAPDDDEEDNNENDESDHNNASGNKNKNTENNNEKNDENQTEDIVKNKENKEEEINDDKYGKNENCEEEKYEEDKYYGDEKYEDEYYEDEKYEGEYYENGQYEEDEYYENEQYDEEENYEENEKYKETKKYDEKSEIIDETIDDTENNDKTLDSPKIDETQKKPQPIITCTEILKSKYTIIRSKDENDKSIVEYAEEEEHNLEKSEEINEVINVEKTSPETYRVSQLKRINLLYDSDDSDDSDSSIEESKKILPEWKRRKNIKERMPASSQVISDPSDSDEWYTKNTPGKKTLSNNEKITKHPSASSLYISDSDNENIVKSTEKKIATPKTKKVVKKSLKSQINDQENNDTNNERLINKNHNNSINDTEPTEAESLQYVLRNILSQNNTQNILESEINTSTHVQDETFPRPVELDEFIEREELIHTHELSTIDVDEIRKSNDDDDDEDIWLMEIPKCIILDRQLCGKKIILEKKRMKIDDDCYETINRKDKLVSCILSAGRDKPEYKAVNVSLVRSIVVRQASSEKSCVPLDQSSTLPKTKIADVVPFPSHIKPRNPLMVLNDEDKRKKLDSSTKDDSFTEGKEDKKVENVSTESSGNEFEERTEQIHSPSKISDTPKIPPQTLRRSTGNKKKKKTPVWRKNNFLLPSKKNKNIQKKL